MIGDPYKVLGLEQDASLDEIKKAYRQMAKAYHPDLHPDDPNITEKMNAINEAYDMLINPNKYAAKQAQQTAAQEPQAEFEVVPERQQPVSNTIARPKVLPEDSPEIQQVVNHLNCNQFQHAIDVLTQIPSAERNARWYYLGALANQMLGNYIPATELMQKACQLEPQNQAYMQLLFQFQQAGQLYEKKAKGGFPFNPLLLLVVVAGYFLGKLLFG